MAKSVTKWLVFHLIGGNVGWRVGEKQSAFAAMRLAQKLEREGKTVWVKEITSRTVYHTHHGKLTEAPSPNPDAMEDLLETIRTDIHRGVFSSYEPEKLLVKLNEILSEYDVRD